MSDSVCLGTDFSDFYSFRRYGFSLDAHGAAAVPSRRGGGTVRSIRAAPRTGVVENPTGSAGREQRAGAPIRRRCGTAGRPAGILPPIGPPPRVSIVFHDEIIDR